MARRLILSAVALALPVFGTEAVAQPRRVLPPTRADSMPRPPAFHHLSVSSAVLSRSDDNVNRDTARTFSIGVIGGVAARLTSSATRPLLVLEYDAAVHRYTATTRFNRVSQRARTTLATRLSRSWGLELIAEGARGGGSEDRDVSDQLSIQPRLEYRIDGARRLRVSASQRWRQFPTDSLQNASNRFVAAEFRHRLSEGAAFEAEARVEKNVALGTRADFRRTSFSTTYLSPIGARTVLEVGMQYRIQRYPSRLVEIDDEDFPRVDHRLQPAIALRMQVAGSELELSYEPEIRQSNDPTKSLAQNVLLVGVRRRWF